MNNQDRLDALVRDFITALQNRGVDPRTDKGVNSMYYYFDQLTTHMHERTRTYLHTEFQAIQMHYELNDLEARFNEWLVSGSSVHENDYGKYGSSITTGVDSKLTTQLKKNLISSANEPTMYVGSSANGPTVYVK